MAVSGGAEASAEFVSDDEAAVRRGVRLVASRSARYMLQSRVDTTEPCIQGAAERVGVIRRGGLRVESRQHLHREAACRTWGMPLDWTNHLFFICAATEPCRQSSSAAFARSSCATGKMEAAAEETSGWGGGEKGADGALPGPGFRGDVPASTTAWGSNGEIQQQQQLHKGTSKVEESSSLRAKDGVDNWTAGWEGHLQQLLCPGAADNRVRPCASLRPDQGDSTGSSSSSPSCTLTGSHAAAPASARPLTVNQSTNQPINQLRPQQRVSFDSMLSPCSDEGIPNSQQGSERLTWNSTIVLTLSAVSDAAAAIGSGQQEEEEEEEDEEGPCGGMVKPAEALKLTRHPPVVGATCACCIMRYCPSDT